MTPTAAEPEPPRLAIAVVGAQIDRAAASPAVELELEISAPEGRRVTSALLAAQVRILTRHRSYDAATRERLSDLFGAPARWGSTLKSLLWMQASLVVPPFAGSTRTRLRLDCTYDFEVASARYLDGLRDGDVPLELLFRGTLFYPGDEGRLRTALLPWDLEARYDLPVALWRGALDRFFPESGWIRLSHASIDRLRAYRCDRLLASWDAAVEDLLRSAGDRPPAAAVQ